MHGQNLIRNVEKNRTLSQGSIFILILTRNLRNTEIFIKMEISQKCYLVCYTVRLDAYFRPIDGRENKFQFLKNNI